MSSKDREYYNAYMPKSVPFKPHKSKYPSTISDHWLDHLLSKLGLI